MGPGFFALIVQSSLIAKIANQNLQFKNETHLKFENKFSTFSFVSFCNFGLMWRRRESNDYYSQYLRMH